MRSFKTWSSRLLLAGLALLAALAAPRPALAAWAHVQGHHLTDTGTTGTLNIVGSAVASGDIVVGFATVGSPNTADILSVTDNQGNSYTLIAAVGDATAGQSFAMFYKVNITNGPTTITLHYTSGLSSVVAFWDEFSGGSSGSAIDGSNSRVMATPGTGTDGVSTGGTFGASGDIIYGAAMEDAGPNTTFTVGTGFATATNDNSDGTFFGISLYTEFKTASAASDVTYTIGTTSRLIVGGLAITTGGGGGGATCGSLPLLGAGC